MTTWKKAHCDFIDCGFIESLLAGLPRGRAEQ